MNQLFQHSLFVLRYHHMMNWLSTARNFYYRLQGMKIGKGTFLPALHITWPHQVKFGINCVLEYGSYLKFVGPWKQGPNIQIGDRVFIGSCCEFNISYKIIIGNDTNIASGCKFIDHDHGTYLGSSMGGQATIEKAIQIGEDVWLGFNVLILKGVQISDGAVVGAGSVVTHSIPANEIWAGIPARKIGERKVSDEHI